MRPTRVARQLWRGVALAGIGLAGGAALVTARHLLMTPQPLDSGLPGEGRIDRGHGGDIYYTVAGPADGRPVVLLHGFYPGASNFEYRAIFARLAETYRVYAPDWLGFGMSERPPLIHTGEFYATTLIGFLRDVIGAPAAVVAYGLAGNIATRAASEAPQLFDRLMLVAPEVEAGMRLDPTLAQTVTRLLQKVALGVTPYAIVSLRPALRLAAGLRSAVGPMQVDDETLDHLYASAHQFGGEYATLSLLTGELDLPMLQIFPLLETPALIVVGSRDARHPLSEMERLVALNPRADLEVVSNAGEAVYLDQPTLFTHALRRWLGRRVARHEHTAAVSAPAMPSMSSMPTMPSMPEAPAAESLSPAPQAVAPEIAAPEAVAVKIVPVLEAQTPHEVRVTRTPDGEALASGSGATEVSQPLSLEPSGETRADTSRTPDTPAMRANAMSGAGSQAGHLDGAAWQSHGSHQTPQASAFQQRRTYHYAPEMGAHVVRSDQGRDAGRSGRRR